MKAAKKQSNLKIVSKSLDSTVEAREAHVAELRAADQEKKDEVRQQWDQMEKSWRITGEEARRRVYALRRELEVYQRGFEGAPFDLAGDYVPGSMDFTPTKFLIELTEELNPVVAKNFEAINGFIEGNGLNEFLDFNSKLFNLRSHAADTGFKIGLLAGVIFSGCSDKTIDRFERGLVVALQCDPNVTKRD